MATIQRYANANTAVTTGWTNPTYAYADDTSYATCAPGRNKTVNSDFGFADFTSGDIPDGATINSVQMRARIWGSSATYVTLGIQGMDTGATSGSEATGTQTSEATLTATLSGITLADLRSASTVLKARVRASQGATSSASGSLDWVDIYVDYTSLSTVTGSFTADAVIQATRASSFTTNAVIKATVTPAGKKADAILRRAQTGAVNANAVLKATDLNSTTANAILRATAGSSFTVNTIRLRTFKFGKAGQ